MKPVNLFALFPVLSACLALLLSSAASAQVPASSSPAPLLTLEQLPRPSGPPPDRALVVPSQVLRWREEAKALEHGANGMPRDPAAAAALYCRASRYGDAESQYSLAWMLSHDRGIARNDAEAAHLFAAAAEQGIAQAERMLAAMGGTPMGEPPPCLRPPEADVLPPKPVIAAQKPGAKGSALARSQDWPAMPPPPQAPAAIVDFVQQVAPEYRLAPALVLAVMATESNFDPAALSPKNAQGLMQLMPDTARRFKVSRLTDPTQNIRGGMAYLRWLLAYFEGDVALALAGYNAGERAVERYRGVPPYAETRAYVRRILTAVHGQRSHPFDAAVTPPSPMLDFWRPVAPKRP
ncbi:transglycosylase SLT domain-containing protein [Kinneretia aquatilis]|uniref:transglycosylase SLT domain-containing protein n=1 Tax=Kinneretia aquatilis TaxID=2070761 RepID=UPI001CBC4946|nr:transglycosylase SLT domain-containing protein [Paucibacter aquatile]WIV98745.1 transglycosylase SLT domain-containing protein [Paucibacter aquatile]